MRLLGSLRSATWALAPPMITLGPILAQRPPPGPVVAGPCSCGLKKARGEVRGSLSVVPIIFVRQLWATTAAWVHGGLAVVLSKRPFRVFRLVTCPNFKFEMTNGRLLTDVSYEGQGRGHRPTRRPEESSENAVHMLRKWTGTCQGRWCGVLMVLRSAQSFVSNQTAVMVQVSRPRLNHQTATRCKI